MKKFFKSAQLFALMFAAGASFCFTACSDDDDVEIQNPDEITTETMFGAYKGTVAISDVATVESEDVGSGTDISATIEDNTIRFVKFPIRDIVLSIVGDETLADMIVEAVGDVDYNIPYEPTLTAEKDSILMRLKPEPLKLAVSIPAFQDSSDNQVLNVEVEVEAGEDAGYNVEDANMKFSITATKVMLDDEQLSDFVSKNLIFDMNQYKVAHN